MSMHWMQRGLVASLVLVGLLAGQTSVLWGQQRRPPGNQPVGRAQLQSPDLRVPAENVRLEEILREWAAASTPIKRLQGTHKRWTYDKVFGVAKEAEGKFYYEAPDKGRMDIEPADIPKEGAEITRHGENFRREPDMPERWICNGKEIQKIDVRERTREVMPIPPEQRGDHIMEGPLPFLFGMPPDEAKRRYGMKLVKETREKIYLFIEPKRQQDRAAWKNAAVILSKRNYLPEAVRLVDPAGQQETVFAFDHDALRINKPTNLFTGDPFNPLLLGYKTHIERVPEPPQGIAQPGTSPGVPSAIGMHYQDASALLKRAGYDVKVRPGSAAVDNALANRVEAQFPQPGAKPGDARTVVLTVYLQSQTAEKVQNHRMAKPAEPRRSTER